MIEWISLFIIVYFVLINFSYIFFFCVSYVGITRYKKTVKLNNYVSVYQSKLTPPISLLVPAYNEEHTIIKNVNAFLSFFNYPEYEIIVINDGSKDKTLELLLEKYECKIYNYPVRRRLDTKNIRNVYRSSIDPRLVVVDKENGGKADALNVGINVSKYPYFGSIDADTILEPDSYLKVIMPMIEDPEKVIASGGIVGVINGSIVNENKIEKIIFPKHFLAGFQVVEYLRAFLFGRYAWTLINALPLISGAFGLFKKEAVFSVGGYSTAKTKKGTVGEDMDLVIRLHKYHLENKIPYKIMFVPDPLSWTQVPEDVKTLRNQRSRWHRGLIETLTENKDMILKPKYGKIGMIALPYYIVFELLSPVVELAGYILLPIFYFTGMIEWTTFIVFLLVGIFLGVLVSLFAVFLESMTFRRYKKVRDMFKMIFFAVLENLGYRQMTLFFRLRGFWQYYRKDEKWGEMKRKKM